MFKKSLVCLFVFGIFATSAFAQFLDVPASSPEYNAIKFLVKEKIFRVGPDHKFMPNKPISRYEMAVLLFRTLRKINPGSFPLASRLSMKKYFKDVPTKNYAYGAIRALYKAGIIKRPAIKRYRGKAAASRFEFYIAFTRMLRKAKIKNGILSRKEYFGKEKKIARKEVAIAIYRAIQEASKQVAVENEVKTNIVPTYPDVPTKHYAHQDILELSEAKILTLGAGKKFKGKKRINRYQAMDLLAKVLEKILQGDEQLKRASYELGYRDVSVLNPAYPSIQKLIGLGLLPAGNQEEFFYGQKRITRYQMAYLFFKPLEDILSGTLKIEKADSLMMYKDVSPTNFAYPVIQKTIWLGALEGGSKKKFHGNRLATRYEMVHFVAQLLRKIYYKIEDKEIVYASTFLDYGYDLSLTTSLGVLQRSNAKTGGGDLINTTAMQLADLSFDRQLSREIRGHLGLRTTYNFGQLAAVAPQLRRVYLLANYSPFLLQAGRFVYYETYDPFGNSLFVDTLSDMVLLDLRTDLIKAKATVNKPIYLANDVTLDTNAATVLLKPSLGPLELALGAGLITKPIDPTGAVQLATRISQYYVGARTPLVENIQFNVEAAAVSYTNEDAVLPFIGFSAEKDKIAYQSALTHFSSDTKLQVSLGYQKIGDDYYMAQLLDPVALVGGGQGTSSWLLKIRNYFSSSTYVGLNVSNVLADGTNISNRYSLLYFNRLFGSTYFTGNLGRTEDKLVPDNSRWNLAGSLSVYF